MKRVLLLSALFAFTTAASAQTIVVNPSRQPMMPGAAEQVRISLGLNIFLPAPNDDAEQSLKAQEDGRRMIYGLAAHECALLLDVLASECRLESVNVNVQRVPGNQFGGQQKPEGFNVNANIGFRVVPK